jgi:hypothetical protein
VKLIFTTRRLGEISQGAEDPCWWNKCYENVINLINKKNMEEKVYHITWTTFNSRVSERMKLYNVKSSKN